MDFIRKLSERGVELYQKEGTLFVVRHTTSIVLKNILGFYNHANFPHMPKLIDFDYEKKILIEEHIPGDLLLSPNDDQMGKVATGIHTLSQKILGDKKIYDYIEENFLQKMNSVILSEEQIEAIQGFFQNFVSLLSDAIIETNWVHGDLKGDNIIHNNGQPYFIDREWVKNGHYIEDIQKFIDSTLKYNQSNTDNFINTFYKYKNIDWKLFVFLETFHFFLNQILQLSKNRVTLENFKRLVSDKINQMINSRIYLLSMGGKTLSLLAKVNPSDIFTIQNEIKNIQKPEYMMYNPNMNNQEQRLEINIGLMLKYQDFVVLHGVCLRLINGMNILIGGPSGSGKTYILTKLLEDGLVEKIFDEDLINLNSNGEITGLANKNFKGKINGDYVYEEETHSFGKLNLVFCIDKLKDGIHISSFDYKNILKYLVHERYKGNSLLEGLYNSFNVNTQIETYIVGNNKRDNDFISLIKFLGKK